MKKAYFYLLGLFTLFMTPGHAQWVFIEEVIQSNVHEIDLVSFASEEYDDYMFVIDHLTPKNTHYNVNLQVGYTDGVEPVIWQTSYAGGVSTIVAGQTSIVSTLAGPLGIPMTNAANLGYSFSGDLRISNTGTASQIDNSSYGPVAIFGQGVFGVDSTGFISGTLNGSTKINSARFIPTDPSAGGDAITYGSIRIYGLVQTPPSP